VTIILFFFSYVKPGIDCGRTIVYNYKKERNLMMILIIDKSKRTRESVSEMFYYMGILSYPAAPMDALSEISTAYGAVLITSTDGIPDPRDYVARLRSYAPLPIFALSYEHSELFDGCFNPDSYSSTVALGIARHLASIGRHVPGTYRLAGIVADADIATSTYFDKPLKFTKTETMILRYLISSYPRPATPTDVLKYAFKASRRPEVSSVRTHISVMNKKFSALAGKPLTLPATDSGYVIATPEAVMERRTILI